MSVSSGSRHTTRSRGSRAAGTSCSAVPDAARPRSGSRPRASGSAPAGGCTAGPSRCALPWAGRRETHGQGQRTRRGPRRPPGMPGSLTHRGRRFRPDRGTQQHEAGPLGTRESLNQRVGASPRVRARGPLAGTVAEGAGHSRGREAGHADGQGRPQNGQPPRGAELGRAGHRGRGWASPARLACSSPMPCRACPRPRPRAGHRVTSPDVFLS